MYRKLYAFMWPPYYPRSNTIRTPYILLPTRYGIKNNGIILAKVFLRPKMGTHRNTTILWQDCTAAWIYRERLRLCCKTYFSCSLTNQAFRYRLEWIQNCLIIIAQERTCAPIYIASSWRSSPFINFHICVRHLLVSRPISGPTLRSGQTVFGKIPCPSCAHFKFFWLNQTWLVRLVK